MLVLNLISEKFKKEIKLKHFYQLIKRINYALVITATAIATILLFAKIVLQNNFIEIIEQANLVTRNNQNYNNKIK